MTESSSVSQLRWLRPLTGMALLLHAFGHMAAAVAAGARIGQMHDVSSAGQAHAQLLWASALVALASSALAAGGLGALGIRVFSARWRTLAVSGLCASLVFLLMFQPARLITGLAITIVLLAMLFPAVRRERAERYQQRVKTGWPCRLAAGLWLAVVVTAFTVMALRPIYLRWGTRPAEAYYPLPGDELPAGNGFQILHAININALPEHIWPWLAQLGHDRGGFYSHAWLENLFGLHIRNAEQINPAWQTRQLGELVPATPENWLGLVDKPMGWRVTCFEPERALTLEGWGTFSLVRIDPANTRFYIRSQGAADQSVPLLWAPIELLLFEPIHFFMQRRMMLGIKERAEGMARAQWDAT